MSHRFRTSAVLRAFVALLALLLAAPVAADPPAGYYDSAVGKRGDALRSALYNIIKGHTSLSYNTAKDRLWDTVDNRGGFVFDIYSGRTSTNLNSDSDGMNTEHSWPQSRGAANTPARSDLHHLFIVDSTWNSTRGSYVFSNVTNPSSSNAYGAKFSSSQGFEVPNDYKGDIARALFYFSVRYQFSMGDNVPLTGSNSSSADDNMGKLTTLIQWHNQDPVSDWERTRHERVWGIQHNRNPFIDHPEYVADMFELGPPAPSITLTTDPVSPRNDQTATIVATISSQIAVNPATVKGFWRVGTTGGFTELAMTRTAGTDTNGTWRSTTTIPAQPGGTRIEYYAEAADTDGTSTRQPATGQQFYVSFEPGAPIINAVTSPAQVFEGDGILVEATITSDAALNASTVIAEYSTSEGDSGNLSMTMVSGTSTNGVWRTTTPVTGLVVDDEFSFAVSAADTEARSTRYPADGFLSVTVQARPTELDISGWKLIETDSNLTLTFPAGTKIAAGGTVIVARKGAKAQFEGVWGALPSNATYIDSFSIMGSNGMVINGGEIFELRNASNALLDGPTATTGMTAQNAVNFRTALDTNVWQNDTDATHATPGVVSLPAKGTGVRITEFADPESTFEEAFVELYYDVPAPDPIVNFGASPTVGHAPLQVTFTDDTTHGTPTTHQWDFDNNGTFDSTAAAPSYTYTMPGLYTVRYVTDLGEKTRTAFVRVWAGAPGIVADILDGNVDEFDDPNQDSTVDAADVLEAVTP